MPKKEKDNKKVMIREGGDPMLAPRFLPMLIGTADEAQLITNVETIEPMKVRLIQLAYTGSERDGSLGVLHDEETRQYYIVLENGSFISFDDFKEEHVSLYSGTPVDDANLDDLGNRWCNVVVGTHQPIDKPATSTSLAADGIHMQMVVYPDKVLHHVPGGVMSTTGIAKESLTITDARNYRTLHPLTELNRPEHSEPPKQPNDPDIPTESGPGESSAGGIGTDDIKARFDSLLSTLTDLEHRILRCVSVIRKIG